MDEEILDLERKVKEKQRQDVELFNSKPPAEPVVEKDENEQLVEQMFNQAIINRVANDKALNERVLSTAKTYVDTSMETISTNVDTKYKAAVFANNKDACESYGFGEKTTPTWAVRFMKGGYCVMLALYLLVASFTVMPIIFLMKKIHTAVKHTWLAIVLAIMIYLGITVVPIVLGIFHR